MVRAGRLFLLCSLVLGVFIPVTAAGYQLEGLQPVQPFGGFATFSTETLPVGAFGAGLQFERAVEENYFRTTVTAGYGLFNGAELLLTAPYVSNWHETVDGLEDTALGFKHRVFGEGKYGPSVAYLLAGSINDGRNDFSSDGAVGGGIIASKKIGPFSTFLNLIYSHPFNKAYSDRINALISLDLRASHDFDIIAEVLVVDDYTTKDINTIEGRFGYRIRTTENIYTLIGIGYDFKNRNPQFRFFISFNGVSRTEAAPSPAP